MSPFLPLLFVGLAALAALRHRAWRGASILLASSVALCAAGEAPEDDDPSLTLGAGASAGRYVEACGPAHRYGTVAIGAEYRKEVARDLDVTAGLRLTGASDDPGGLLGTAQPMVGLDHTGFGLAAGVHLGQFYAGSDQPQVAFPAGRLRIGPRNSFFVDASLADHFAGSFPRGFLMLGAGIGLPPRLKGTGWNHPILRAGVADSGFYLAPEIGIGPRVTVDVFGSYSDSDTYKFALGLRYRPPLQRGGPAR